MGLPVNIQERIGKTVGMREGIRDPLSLEGSRKSDMIARKKAFPAPFVPRGGYRFKTHEEADAWNAEDVDENPLEAREPSVEASWICAGMWPLACGGAWQKYVTIYLLLCAPAFLV